MVLPEHVSNLKRGVNILAKKDSFQTPRSGALKKLAGQITDNINKIYGTTHYSPPVNMRDLSNIRDNINSSINNITSINMQQNGEPNISKLYSRLQSTLEDPQFRKGLEDMFNDKESIDSVLQSYSENKYLKDLDAEIDAICKYQPKLIEALETKKDNVLSADHFAKDYINLLNNTSISLSTFEKRADGIKEKYDLLAQAEIWYMNASKYGEQFLYIVPYSRAISKLMKNIGNTSIYPSGSHISPTSSKISSSRNILKESFEFTDKPILEGASQTFRKDSFDMSKHGSIKVELDMNCMLTETVMETYKALRESSLINESSLCLEHTRLIEEAAILAEAKNDPKVDSGKIITKRKIDKTLDDLDISEFNFKDPIAQDGLIDQNKEEKEEEITAPGCIIKKLDRVYVKPHYIEDLCLGYFYIELKKSQDFNFDKVGLDSINNAKNINKQMIEDEKGNDLMLKQTAANISKAVTPKFVNTNADISKEIYMILKYNDVYNNNTAGDTLKVTFLPADDVVHIKFKEDPVTHRGISDLEYSLFPAKLRSCIQLTYAIANMTRGYDRRVYYVKQSVETNIAKTLMNTINQLKKSNFNLRQVESIQSIFNITGMLNDYMIPTMGGEAPIQFEVMPGQRIEPPTDLLNELEEQMINPTDVPLELIQARMSMDYAVHYTMTNSKFLRKIYHRQGQYQRFLSIIFTKIFNYEYNMDATIEVQLPPPVFLNITNSNQIISNTNEFSEQIVAIDMADETDEMVKTIYGKKVKKHYLNSYLDIGILDKFREEAEQEAAIKKSKAILQQDG